MSFELGEALDAWEADGFAVPTPFDTDAYVLEELAAGEDFEAESARQNEIGREANQNGDNYVLVTVLLTSALFFAGISTVLDNEKVRYALIAGGAALFVFGAVLMATFPIE